MACSTVRPCRSRALYRSYRRVQLNQELQPTQPWDPNTKAQGHSATPSSLPPQQLQPHLPPLPKLLLHQSADAKLLVHLFQQLGLWEREE
jgi:hypothetical protein